MLLGGLFYHYEGIVTDAITFLSDAFTDDPELGRWFDVLALHPYPHYPPQAAPEADDGHEQPVGQMVARLRAELAYYGADKPVWVTEVGWPVYGTVDEAAQARFTVRAAVEALAAGAERVCLYTLDDGPNPSAFPPEDAFGLYRNDGTPKPAATALHTLVSIDPALAVSADGSDGGLRRYTLASPSTRVDVVFAVDGALHAIRRARRRHRPRARRPRQHRHHRRRRSRLRRQPVSARRGVSAGKRDTCRAPTWARRGRARR